MDLKQQFFTLTPDRILDAVEHAIGRRSTGRTLALNSMENRVYEIELEEPLALKGDEAAFAGADATRVVAKFYRPGRWSRETILEEHGFTQALAAAEVPAVAPLELTGGGTLQASDEGIFFAVFPKVRGRILQELDDSQLGQVGRLLARMHNIGATRAAAHRIGLTTESYGLQPLSFLESTGLLPEQFQSRYRGVVEAIVGAAKPLLDGAAKFRVHGDCHLGNVLWQHTGPFFLDFDDMVTGPAVQDIWLVVRGRDDEAVRQRETLLRSYESMREFDWSTLALIEPLRALRMIHYAAWIARRWEDPTFKRAFPDFASTKYWVEEINDLDQQLELITNRREDGF